MKLEGTIVHSSLIGDLLLVIFWGGVWGLSPRNFWKFTLEMVHSGPSWDKRYDKLWFSGFLKNLKISKLLDKLPKCPRLEGKHIQLMALVWPKYLFRNFWKFMLEMVHSGPSTSILKMCKHWYAYGTVFSGTIGLSVQYILKSITLCWLNPPPPTLQKWGKVQQ